MRTERSEGEQLEGEAEPEACRRMAEKQEQSLAGREPRGSMQRIGIGSRGWKERMAEKLGNPLFRGPLSSRGFAAANRRLYNKLWDKQPGVVPGGDDARGHHGAG